MIVGGMFMAHEYTVADIQVLEGLEAVRKRPGMYIGSTGSRGIHQLLWEIVDNAMDEAANGYATHVTVDLFEDGSISVEDNGRGIPVGIHPEYKVSGVELVFNKLHAGGKFNNENYAFSGGLHGVGASVVNALSEWLKVEVYRDGHIYEQEYRSYEEDGKEYVGHPMYPLRETGDTKKHGTKVTYMADSTVFDSIFVQYDRVSRRLQELSYLIKGVTIILRDHREKPMREVTYNAVGGIVDYLVQINKDRNPAHPLPIHFEGEKNGIYAEIAIQYLDSEKEYIYSYVNNIATGEGGTHETGFKTGLTKVMNDFLKKIPSVQKEKLVFEGDDFREGISAIISVKMKEVQFEGQTKTRLGNPEARVAVEAITSEGLASFLEDLNNTAVANKMAEKAVTACKSRIAAKKAKKLARDKIKADAAPLVGKLSSCTGRKPELNELFIVEGDSAGGSAKMGRDRRFQAILPLRGKPLNVEKKRLDQVLANEEFRSLITALGAGFDKGFRIEDIKYHKIIILADADQDGAHIRAILLTFFFRYFRELITEGHVFIAQPPLYSVKKGNKTLWVHTEKQLNKAKEELGRGAEVKRYKGLGEMSSDQLWETTMDPNGRVLLQVTVEDAAACDNIISILMGDNVDPRRQYISEYANFNKTDSFQGNIS